MEVPELGFAPTLPVLLRRAVELYGDHELVVTVDGRVSFAEADARSAELAKALLAAGIGKGARVGMMLPSGVAWVLVWLALARIGAVSLCLSTTYRRLEIAKSLRFGDMELLIAPNELFGRDLAGELEEAIPGLEEQQPGRYRLPAVPYLRDVWLLGEQQPGWARSLDLASSALPFEPADISDELLTAVEDQVAPADLITIIYTSGSSADPKAVMHTHGGAVRKVAPAVGLGLWSSRPGRVLVAMPLFWVGGPQCVLGALHSGSTMLCLEKYEPARALQLAERERATALGGWAALVDKLLTSPLAERHDLSSLEETPRFPPPGTPGAAISSRGDGLNVGMTETFGPHRDRRYFDYKVVDPETGESMPDGAEGEFCVRGFGLMAGMYRREREDVFDEDGYYHTGDRGYIEDGHIYFTGRYSEMIKTSGANVAPLEVEMALLELEDVDQAYVFGVPDAERSEAVVAVLVATPGFALDPAHVRARLRTMLSGYKVPVRIETMDENAVPRLANGKPDKRSMRQLVAERHK